jgi:hypothetical protein
MGKNTFGSNVGNTEEEMIEVEEIKEREVELVFISDGIYKYVYADTKEDVV